MSGKCEGLYDHYYKDSAMHRHLSSESLREAENKDKKGINRGGI